MAEITSVLPDEVLEVILLRLPVKHLLSLKCVCKDWYALIGDSRFHKKHYRFQYAKHIPVHNDIPLFLHNPFQNSFPDQGHFYLLSKCQGVDVVLDLTPDFYRDIPPLCFNDLYQRKVCLQCLGVVNGVVCLEWNHGDRKGVSLWNPAIREFKKVTRWPLLLANENTLLDPTMVGFGFDIQANDFKMLIVIYNVDNPRDEVYELHLYSLMADSWKRIKEFPSSLTNFRYSRTDTFLNNGVIYWLTMNSRHYRFLSFNLSTETFKESELPEGCGSDCNYEHMIGKYKEGIELYVTRTLENTYSSIEIWAVSKFSGDDNGVPLTWQHVCTTGPIQSFKGLEICTVRVCGDLLLAFQPRDSMVKREGCIYNPSTRTFNFFNVIFWSSFSYVESLYCLSGRVN